MGWLHKTVAAALLRIQHDRRHRLRFIMPSHRPFENNLHHIVNDFMAGGEDFWLSIDNDNPPLKNPLDLVDLDLDIVGLPTPVFHWTGKAGERPIYWNGYDYVPETDAYREHMPKEGLQRVDAVGTGCFLVSRRVFENPTMRLGAFQRQWNVDGTVERGNDIAFCERAREQGFEIWCHYDYPCNHIVEVPLNDIVASIKGLIDG